MKIEKEIFLAGKIEEIRELLLNGGFNALDIAETKKNGKEGMFSGKHGKTGGKKTTLISNMESINFDFSDNRNKPLETKYDLAEEGNKTRLRVVVSGWDKIDPETAKSEMPKIALELERCLSSMKKSIESRR